jgi:hypothetical protein
MIFFSSFDVFDFIVFLHVKKMEKTKFHNICREEEDEFENGGGVNREGRTKA